KHGAREAAHYRPAARAPTAEAAWHPCCRGRRREDTTMRTCPQGCARPADANRWEMVLDCAAARSRDTEIRRADLRSELKAVLARSPPIQHALRIWWLSFLYIALNGINGLC